HFAFGDIRNQQLVKICLRDVEAVVHLAAIARVKKSIEEPLTTHDINASGTLNLLKASSDARVRKFVFASSCDVYGDAHELPISEGHPVNPLSPYAASKLAGEGYCQAFARSYGLDTACLRLFSVYGPRQYGGEYGGVISRSLDRLSDNLPPIIEGDGEQYRDFIHVRDVADAVLKVLRGEKCAGEVYNIGSGKATKVNELIRLLQRLVGKEGIEPMHLDAVSGEIRSSLADIRKAVQQLGFGPRLELEEGLSLLVGRQMVYADR
ncbi:MAG: NAD-dependent epimerase/dehydratase family protein, partial [Thaumarchaeota archaeon]